MKKKTTHFLMVNNKRCSYTVAFLKKGWVYFDCEEADIGQEFLAEDIPALLIDLPELILAEWKWKKKQEQMIRFRVSVQEKKEIMKKALKKGYKSVSSFLRDLAKKA
jgi:hypothetical protein